MLQHTFYFKTDTFFSYRIHVSSKQQEEGQNKRIQV